MLVLRAAPGVWKQPESLQRQGPNLARGGVVVCQPLSGGCSQITLSSPLVRHFRIQSSPEAHV